MTIKIDHSICIRQLNKKLQAGYPFLKIEFSDRPHGEGEQTRKGHWYDIGFKLFDIAKKKEVGFVSLQPWHKVGQVEELFKTRFGLYPQIFRRENDKWIQTAGTDVFTLDEQNEIGKKTVEKNNGSYWIEREILL